MTRRLAFLSAVASLPLPIPVVAGDLDELPPNTALWQLLAAVEQWGDTRRLDTPAELVAAFLNLSTASHRFAQGLAIYLNSWNDDTRAAQSGLDDLARALRHVLLLAQHADPEWRAFVDDSALNMQDLREWLTTVDDKVRSFRAFQRASDRLEWIARRMAAAAI